MRDWCDALIVPVLKKDNLKLCDNWRRTSLLDVVGKVLGIITSKLVAEDILSDSQCGQSDFFTLYVDLKKVHDTVPWPALWRVLGGWRFF